MSTTKVARREKIHKRIRHTITGTATKPRLCVFRSNKQIYVQVIDDVAGKTLACASSAETEIAGQTGNKSQKARMVGQAIAKKAIAAGIETIVFDRGGYLYHGRVKELADGAREGGLKF